MQNLFQFFARFGTVILFVLLEIICFYLIIRYNSGQKDIFINSSSFYSGLFLENYNKLTRYYRLSSVADSLAKDNARLRAELRFATIDASFRKDTLIDTTYLERYTFLSAEVVGNSINQVDNYITINKGKAHGIEPGMGVINETGLVGVVRYSTQNYSTLASLLSAQTKISAAIKTKGYFGSLMWDNKSTDFVHLKDIPKHAEIAPGDTVITSGYSSVFPKGIMIGTITEVNVETGSSFYDLKVRLSNNIASLEYVYVILDRDRTQLDTLKKYTSK